MKRFERFRSNLQTTQTTPYNRAVGFALGVINTPGLIIGVLLTIVGYGYPLPLLIAGTVLYIRYWDLYKDKATHTGANLTWTWTLVFNAILATISGSIVVQNLFKGEPWIFMMALAFGFQVWVMFLAVTAKRDLKKRNNATV